MKVYLAGPIAGCDKDEATNWRDSAATYFRECGIQAISPLRCEPLIGERYALSYQDKRFGTPQAISGKNWFDTVNCDIVLAYLPTDYMQRRPSYGTIIEIGWAIGMRKPIVLVSDHKGLVDHPLISANINWIFNESEITQAYETIAGLAGVYK